MAPPAAAPLPLTAGDAGTRPGRTRFPELTAGSGEQGPFPRGPHLPMRRAS